MVEKYQKLFQNLQIILIILAFCDRFQLNFTEIFTRQQIIQDFHLLLNALQFFLKINLAVK